MDMTLKNKFGGRLRMYHESDSATDTKENPVCLQHTNPCNFGQQSGCKE